MRLKEGLTQEQLAARLDKSVETVSNLERGIYATSLDTLQRVGRCLGVPMTYFFEGSGNERKVSKTRMDRELELRRLAEGLSDDQLQLAVRLVNTIRDNK